MRLKLAIELIMAAVQKRTSERLAAMAPLRPTAATFPLLVHPLLLVTSIGAAVDRLLRALPGLRGRTRCGAYLAKRLRNSVVVLLWGKGSAGIGTPRKAHRFGQPSAT